MTESNLPVLVFLLPFAAALLVGALGWIVPGKVRWIAHAALAATAGVAALALSRVMGGETMRTSLGGWPPPFGIEVALDPLSALVAAMVAVVALVIVAGSDALVQAELEGRRTAYYAATLLLLSGLLGIVVTRDLFNLFVQLEVASLAAYALVASGGRGAPRAALTYLLIGSLGATLYLMGVAFLYGATGSLNMSDVARLLPAVEPRLSMVSGLLIVAGLGIKAALFPLHTWMPGAYAHAPFAASALMAPLVTKVAAYAIIRIVFWVFGAGTLAGPVILLDLLLWAGVGAIVAGGVLGFLQQDLRRLWAYSSVGQMGVIAVGAGLASAAGFTGAVLHIASDALMKGALFLAAGVALVRFGVSNVDDLRRLRGRAPWTSACVVVAGLSLIGVPPLGGFFGKWYVLTAAVGAGRWFIAAALVVGTLLTIAYVVRVLEPLFFGRADSDRDTDVREHVGSRPVLAACAGLATGVVLLGLANARVVALLVLPAIPGRVP